LNFRKGKVSDCVADASMLGLAVAEELVLTEAWVEQAVKTIAAKTPHDSRLERRPLKGEEITVGTTDS
jgi:hypothetical protein